jgi:hypothetical protein
MDSDPLPSLDGSGTGDRRIRFGFVLFFTGGRTRSAGAADNKSTSAISTTCSKKETSMPE